MGGLCFSPVILSDMTLLHDEPEQPIIRPPSEWQSLLVRVTRGCHWNRCRFCGIYPALGEPGFSVRSVEEVKHDIDLLRLLRPRAENAFFGDADPLQAGLDDFCEIARYVRKVFAVNRLTCYARASTLYKLKQEGIAKLADAGLNRVHIGLESGDAGILRFHRKGQSPEMVEKVSVRLKEAGIEISFYVLLGLGGRDNWHNHIRSTAKVINAVDPEFVRVRRLWLHGGDTAGPGSPLIKLIRSGDFVPQTPEGTVLELRALVDQLDSLSTFFTCDHHNNYVHISGKLKEDQDEMLAEIDAFLGLPDHEREAHYASVGSRI